MATIELFDTSTKTQQVIPKESRIKLNEQRNCELNVNNYNNVLLDVEFSFNNGETKLRAHKLILLDCPPSEFFVEKLAKNVGHGLVVIEVPNEINSESADAILDFIYGKPLIELWVTNHEFDLEGFLNGARFFQMEIMFLKQLATISRVPNPRLESYVSNNFQRLKTSAEFWNIENELILQLCRAIPLESEIVVDGFLDWIYENKAKRREFLDKLMELRQLIKLGSKNGDDRGVSMELEPSSLTLANEHLESDENESDATGTQRVEQINLEDERSGNSRRNQKRKVQRSDSFKRHPKRSKSKSLNGYYDSGSDTAENESSQDTSEEIEQINLDVEPEPQRGKRTSQKRKCIQRNPSSSHRPPKTSKPGPSTKTKNSKPSKMDGFFNRNLNYIRAKLTEKKWRQKEFFDGWTTIWEYMTLKNNKLQAVKNEQRFVHGKGFDLLLDSRRAIGNDYHKYPIFSQAFINIVYNFSGGQNFDYIIQDEILTYLLEDVKNPCNFKEHDSTLAGQTLAEILDLYDSTKWSLNISRKLVSTKLEEAILNSWDFNGTRTMNYIQSLPNLKDLVDLIESNDPTATLCGLWLMVYHTKSDTPNQQRNEEALKYVEYLKKETSFQSTLINCEGVGIRNRHVATYVRKLVDIFEFDNDNFFNKQLREIRTHLSEGSWETKSFTTAWVAVRKILFNRDFGNMYEYEFLNEDGISLLIDSRRKLGKEYQKYPFFFEEFLNIIYLFSCKECYVRFVFTDQIIEFILEDLPRYETFGDSVTAGEIACYLLHFYKTNDWHSTSTTREDVATRVKEAITGHWDLNVDLDLCFSDISEFDTVINMIRSNDTTLNLFGVWMLTYSTKSDTTNGLRNKKAKSYISWLKNTKHLKESLRKFVQQTEDSHISNLARQLMTNFGFKLWLNPNGLLSLSNKNERDNNLVELEQNLIILENGNSDSWPAAENESQSLNTAEPPKRKQRNRKRKFANNQDTSENGHASISNPRPSKTKKRRFKKSKPSKMDRFFNNRLIEIRTILDENKWRTKEFSETWTTIWEFMTLKNNKCQATKNEDRFRDGKGLDLLLESRRAIRNEYSKYPTFSQAFISIIYNFSGSRNVYLINSEEILTYLLEDLHNPCNFKDHDSTLVGQTLAQILYCYDSDRWSLNISRELVSTKLEEAILNSWDFNQTRTMSYTRNLADLDDLVSLIESDDSTTTLCGLWLMVYHTKSDTSVQTRNEEAMTYVDFLKDTDLYKTLYICEQYGDCHVSTFARKLINIFGFTLDVIFDKQINEIRTHLSKGTWESNDFISSWVSVSQILDSFLEEDRFMNEDGFTLLLDSRNKLGKAYYKYPEFFEKFLDIIYMFSCKDYVHCTDEIVQFMLEDIVRYDTPEDSVTAGEIAGYFLYSYEPNDWHFISTRELVATKLEEAITEHWNLNVDLRRGFESISDFQHLLDLIESNDTTVNLLGMWMLIYATKSNTANELRNKEAKEYIGWLKDTSLEKHLKKFVEQKENSHISNLAKQLLNCFVS